MLCLPPSFFTFYFILFFHFSNSNEISLHLNYLHHIEIRKIKLLQNKIVGMFNLKKSINKIFVLWLAFFSTPNGKFFWIVNKSSKQSSKYGLRRNCTKCRFRTSYHLLLLYSESNTSQAVFVKKKNIAKSKIIQ